MKRKRKKAPFWEFISSIRFTTWVILLLLLALIQFIAAGILYVPAKKMAILIRKTGEDLRHGEILAIKPGQKGIQLHPVAEGFHWYNPYTWDWVICDQVEVPEGKVGIQVRLYGKPLKEWQVIAEEGQKGILREVLKPGRYLINPYAIKVILHDAVTVPPGHRGVVWNLSGKIPANTHKFLVEEGERGVLKETLEAGTYYFNPFVKRVIPVDMRSHRFDTQQKDPIRFPSRDGFEITMNVVIEWAIDPNRLAEVYVKYVDLRGVKKPSLKPGTARRGQKRDFFASLFGQRGHTPTFTQMLKIPTPSSKDVIDCIVEKIILPNVRSFTRLEGSNYPAIDFIRGEKRIQFQRKFGEELRKNCGKEGVLIRSALIRNVLPPDEIALPIRMREIAIRNAEKYKKQMEREEQEKRLAMERKLEERQRLVTRAKTQQDVAKVEALKRQQVAITLAKQKLEVAKRSYQAALDQAAAILTRGKAKAYVIYQKNKAEAAGLREAAESFGGGQEYVLYLFNKKIAPSIVYILSNTEGPFMKIFEKVLLKHKGKDFIPKERQIKPLKIEELKEKKKQSKKAPSKSKKEEKK